MVKPKTKKPTWQHKIQGLLKKVRISPNQSVALFGLIFAVVGIVMLILSSASAPYKTESFDTDPHWDSFNNLPTADSLPCRQVSFNFGWTGNSASGSQYPNMIGGDFTHSTAYRAYYAKQITPKNLDNSFNASGTLVVPKKNGVDVSIGWFNHATSTDWRASDSMLIHIAQPPDTSLTEVDFNGSSFAPKAPLIKVGDTVQWTNTDTADHQIVIDGIETSPVLHKSQRYKHIFTSTGTFTFHDASNSAISGIVKVEAADYFRDFYSAFAEIGTRNSLSNGTKASSLNNVDAYEFGQTYNWSLKYDPNGGPAHHGTLTMTIGENVGSVDIDPEVRADGANFDRFGFLATQAPPSGGAVTAYVDNLIIDGSSALSFNGDPNWDAYNNRPNALPDMLPKDDCYPTNRQNFNYLNTNRAGGRAAGEIGGALWPQPPAYYGDRTGELKLNKDVLYATGKITLGHDTLDSDLWLGWFNADSDEPSIRPICHTKATGQLICIDMAGFNVLGAHIGGPTHFGYRFSPYIRNNTSLPKIKDTDKPMAQRQDANFDETLPALNTHGASRDFWICYVPNIDSQHRGRITTGLSPDTALGLTQKQSEKIIPAWFIDSASFNRFGVIGASEGGKVVEIFLDDLRYTVGPDDSGPTDRCGPPPDTAAPSINLTSPANGATIAGKTTLSASASDNVAVSGVQFKLDGFNLGSEITHAPYDLPWDTTTVANGSHRITAVARDAAGNNTTPVAIKFIVNNPGPDTTSPSVPTNLHLAAVSKNTITLDWDLSTDNTGGTGVGGYKVFRDGNYLTSTSTPHFTDTGLTANTAYKYSILAYDNAVPRPNESAQSPQLTVTTSTAPSPLAGDVDGDGHVNIRDISVVLSHYGQFTSTGDANNDGVVDIKDISVIISNYGK